jgi:tyrosinase
MFTDVASRFALQGMPFTIHVLIGKAPENDTPMDAVEYKNVVGQVFNFVAPLEYDINNNNDNGDTTTSGGCVNCKKQAEEKSESTGQVVLTNALITRYKQQIIHENRDDASQILASMEPADVIGFLKKNLHWRITGVSKQPPTSPSQFVPKSISPIANQRIGNRLYNP